MSATILFAFHSLFSCPVNTDNCTPNSVFMNLLNQVCWYYIPNNLILNHNQAHSELKFLKETVHKKKGFCPHSLTQVITNLYDFPDFCLIFDILIMYRPLFHAISLNGNLISVFTYFVKAVHAHISSLLKSYDGCKKQIEIWNKSSLRWAVDSWAWFIPDLVCAAFLMNFHKMRAESSMAKLDSLSPH